MFQNKKQLARYTSKGPTTPEPKDNEDGKIEWIDLSLKMVLKESLKTIMKTKDWKIVAIDVVNDKLILKRYNFGGD